jgi:hypothetical protein
MIERAVAAGVPFSWVAGDEVYGGNPKLRAWLEQEEISYVLAVACEEMTAVAAGTRRADALAALVPAGAWQRLSCADGSKGPRVHDGALIETASPVHRLLVRRSLQLNAKGEHELAYFLCYSPRPVTLAELVAVAGARRAVEDCFAEANNEAGLDHYQVRLYRAWYRHITLSMLGHAFLAVTARALRPAPPGLPAASADAGGEAGKKGSAAAGRQIFAPPRTYSPPPVITGEHGSELIPLTAAQTRRLFTLHTTITRPKAYHEYRSDWRRCHQARARRCHYRRRISGLKMRL